MSIQRFLRDTRAGATAITAAAVVVMAIGGTVVLSDTAWLLDQRDVLKAASGAAGIAATQEMTRLMDTQPGISDADFESALEKVAWRYAVLNFGHLPEKRLKQAKGSLVVEVTPDRSQRTVDVSIQADLGGTLLSKHMPMFGDAGEPGPMRAKSVVESTTNPIEVVLALDMSESMDSRLDGRSSCDRCPDSRINTVKRAAATLVDILQPDANNRIAVGVVPWDHAVRLDARAAAEWSKNDWARYPTRRVYGEPYVCRGNNCTPPAAAVEHPLPPTAPEGWNGCLDSHRIEILDNSETPDIRASVPTNKFFTPPSEQPFAQRFFAAVQGSAYECAAPPLPAGFEFQHCFHGTRYYGSNGYPPIGEPQYGCTGDNPTIVPLSADADALHQAIDALKPTGVRTYSALGVLWGQRVLDHRWKDVWGGDVHPVGPGDRSSEGLRKAIVLLTDGEDTHCGLDNATCSGKSALGIARSDACAAAKAQGTEIFVIAAMHPNKVSKALGDSLRECSSESDETDVTYAYLNHSTPKELETTFSEIANQLRVVRRVY